MDTSKVKALLLKAKELITPEGSWTQGEFAMDADGAACTSSDRQACKFCASGAVFRAFRILKISPDEPYFRSEAVRALDRASGSVYSGGIVNWNDTAGRTQDQVLAIFDKAINSLDEPEHKPEPVQPDPEGTPSAPVANGWTHVDTDTPDNAPADGPVPSVD